jgi:hypothetical protein
MMTLVTCGESVSMSASSSLGNAGTKRNRVGDVQFLSIDTGL